MTIAILSALPQEQAGLLNHLENTRSVLHAGRSFVCGHWQGHEVVLALSGIGKVAAATTATALIEKFGVQRILFTGVAGGLGADVRVGDVVVAQNYVQHDMDASPLVARWWVPGYASADMACDVALTEQLAAAAGAYLSGVQAQWLVQEEHQETQQTAPAPDVRAPRLHHGLIVSGDQFVSTAKAAHALRSGLESAGHMPLAVEMEGAAVAQVCLDYGVPFAAVRTISDRADDSAHLDFAHFVEAVASHYAEHIMLGFLQRLPEAA